jgi:hypothetical protein
VLNMLSMVLCAESCGGLAGGEAKRAECSRVCRGCDECDECDESQDRAEGSSMVATSSEAQLAPEPIGLRMKWDSSTGMG